jgi:hypothetical protein
MAKDIAIKKETLTMKRDAEMPDEEPRKNVRADLMPTEGYGLEVDGKMKSHHTTSEAAFAAGLALKAKYPVVQVKVFAAKEQTRTIVELPKP